MRPLDITARLVIEVAGAIPAKRSRHWYTALEPAWDDEAPIMSSSERETPECLIHSGDAHSCPMKAGTESDIERSFAIPSG